MGRGKGLAAYLPAGNCRDFKVPTISTPFLEIRMPTPSTLPAMSNTAFAGLLRLLLTPLHEAPKPSAELRAYLAYLNRTHLPAKTARQALPR